MKAIEKALTKISLCSIIGIGLKGLATCVDGSASNARQICLVTNIFFFVTSF
jgi:hypothetical protein